MSQTEQRLPLARADRLAAKILAELSPACERIEVAGSIRRRKPDVGDIEIVAIPRFAVDLFGEPTDSLLDPVLRRLGDEGRLRRLLGGHHFQQFEIVAAGCKLDLFTPNRETWGIVFTLRTGSAAFSHQIVTPLAQRTSDGRPGLLPNDLHVHRARVWRGKEHVPTPEEVDVFAVARIPWIPPEQRC